MFFGLVFCSSRASNPIKNQLYHWIIDLWVCCEWGLLLFSVTIRKWITMVTDLTPYGNVSFKTNQRNKTKKQIYLSLKHGPWPAFLATVLHKKPDGSFPAAALACLPLCCLSAKKTENWTCGVTSAVATRHKPLKQLREDCWDSTASF